MLFGGWEKKRSTYCSKGMTCCIIYSSLVYNGWCICMNVDYSETANTRLIIISKQFITYK